MKEIQGQKFYNRRDLVAMLGVTEQTIAKKQKTGEIPSVRIGRLILTSETQLQKFLDGETKPRN